MRRLFVLLVALAIGLGLAAPAAAAAPVPTKQDIQVWPEYEDSGVVFLQTVEYAPTTPLPIRVQLAVPKGANVYWSGEILGGPPSQDISAIPKVAKRRGYDVVGFTLTKSRIAQVEAKWTALKITGQQRSLVLDWVQAFPAKRTFFQVKAPSQSSRFKMTPAYKTVATSPENLQNYTSAPVKLAVGQKLSFKVSYARTTSGPSVTPQGQGQGQTGQAPGPPTAPPAPANNTLIYILIALAAGAVAYFIFQRREAALEDGYYDEGDYYEEDEDYEEEDSEEEDDSDGSWEEEAPEPEEPSEKPDSEDGEEFDEFDEFDGSGRKAAARR